MKKRITLPVILMMIITGAFSQTTPDETDVTGNFKIEFRTYRILDYNTTWYNGFHPTDLEIKTLINNALINNEHTNEWQIIVNVNDGIVTLWGVVDSLLEKRETESTVSDINGVRKVINKIIVNYPYSDNHWDDYPYYDLFIDPPVIIENNALYYNEINNITEREMFWIPYSDAFKLIDAKRASLTVFRFGSPL